MKKCIKNRIIHQNDEAVVGIVVTVLLIGLILAALVMVNTIYVPDWLEESEAVHMEDVSNQFSQLKYALDLQSMVNDTTSMTTYVTLGNKEVPFFDTGRTFGSLQIDEESFNITIEHENETVNTSFITDSIRYSSGNSYFVNQDYIFQAGALILAQDQSNVLIGKPPLYVDSYGPNSNITFKLINIIGVSGKTAVSGYGIYPIYTELKDIEPSFEGYRHFYNVSNITIYTEYTNTWNKTIISAFLNHLTSDHYTLTENEHVSIEISFKNPLKIFRLRTVNILTQISGGIAE